MIAVPDRLFAIADATIDISKHRLRSHIAKILAKIPSGKRLQADFGQDRVEAKLL